MKAVILAGGAGTRMGHETAEQPKPLVEVAGRPIIWHILKLYEAHGISDFIVCAGYLVHRLKEHFAAEQGESWTVEVVDTGEMTVTAGRLRRIRDHVKGEAFCMTYGDGVTDLDITRLIQFHREQGKLVTVTAVEPICHTGC